jgi:phospholipid/cholesterol/gamma-HCH transport system substrate-binding protein
VVVMKKMAQLGLFIFGAVVILFTGVFVIGNQQRMFTHTYHLRAEFPTVSGLLGGAEVRLGGVRKGTVDEIRLPLRPGGKVLVVMSLDDSTRNLVKQDSMAAIETEGLLGNKFLAISFGSPQSPGIKDWDTIGCLPPLDVSDLLKKTGDIMDTTHRTLTRFETTSEHIAAITARVDRGDGSLGAALNDRGLYNKLSAATTDIAATSGEARQMVAEAKVGVTAFAENMQALKHNILFRGYFKDRGYLDATELTKWEIAKLPEAAPLKSFMLSTGDLFEKPTAMKLKDKKRLTEVGTYLETNPFGLVVIQAFTGHAGSREENLVLTQAQAVVVRTFLAEKFDLDDAKLKTKGMGEVDSTRQGDSHWIEISVYAANDQP